jgi:DNA-binding LacI/PurR family transcriptional regulator
MPGRTAVTIRDVAAEAGVSLTTVSHVLNGKGRVSPTTRERVLAVAGRLGYSANVHARSLASRRSMILAIQVSGYSPTTLVPGSAYFQQLLEGASAAALDSGMALVVAPSGATESDLRRLPADGAVIVDPSGDEPIRRVMADHSAPVVTTGRIVGAAGQLHDCVDNDHRAAAIKVLEHLRANDYRRPALLTSRRRLSYSMDAIGAYQTWAKQFGLEPVTSTVPDVSVGAGQRAATAELRRRSPPDAFYATTDDLAIGVMLAAKAIGLAIPNDLGLVAATDTPALQSAAPGVTALDLRAARIGAEAVQLLVARLDSDEPDHPVTVTVPTRLLPRGSTRRRDP